MDRPGVLGLTWKEAAPGPWATMTGYPQGAGLAATQGTPGGDLARLTRGPKGHEEGKSGQRAECQEQARVVMDTVTVGSEGPTARPEFFLRLPPGSQGQARVSCHFLLVLLLCGQRAQVPTRAPASSRYQLPHARYTETWVRSADVSLRLLSPARHPDGPSRVEDSASPQSPAPGLRAPLGEAGPAASVVTHKDQGQPFGLRTDHDQPCPQVPPG